MSIFSRMIKALVLSLVISGSASAATFSVDFQTYPEGTNFGTQVNDFFRIEGGFFTTNVFGGPEYVLADFSGGEAPISLIFDTGIANVSSVTLTGRTNNVNGEFYGTGSGGFDGQFSDANWTAPIVISGIGAISLVEVFLYEGQIDGITIEYTAAAAPVPEPSTWLLMAAGLFGLGWMRKRRA